MSLGTSYVVSGFSRTVRVRLKADTTYGMGLPHPTHPPHLTHLTHHNGVA